MTRRGARRQRVVSYTYRASLVLLGVLVVWSLVSNIMQMSPLWQLPAIFASLFLLLTLAYQTADTQAAAQADAERSAAALERLTAAQAELTAMVAEVHASTAERGLGFAEHVDTHDLYSSLHRAVEGAERRVLATYVRPVAPTDAIVGPAGAAYFAALRTWAARPGRQFRRVVGDTGRPDMAAWLAEEAAATSPSYRVRTVPYGSNTLSVVLIDRELVFLVFPGFDDAEVHGVSFRSASVHSFLVQYFEQVWAGGTDLRAPAGRESVGPVESAEPVAVEQPARP